MKVKDDEKLVALKKRIDFFTSFGAWQSEKSAEQLAEDLQKDRYFIDKDINFD